MDTDPRQRELQLRLLQLRDSDRFRLLCAIAWDYPAVVECKLDWQRKQQQVWRDLGADERY